MILNGDFMILIDGLCIEKNESFTRNNPTIFLDDDCPTILLEDDYLTILLEDDYCLTVLLEDRVKIII